MSSLDPTARLADLREELEARIAAREEETHPGFWPPLDLLLRELTAGETRYHRWSLAMAARKVAANGVGYDDARQRVKETALEIAEELDPHEVEGGNRE